MDALFQTFKVNDIVRWSSQANGYTVKKQGTIIRVLPAGVKPEKDRYPSLYGNHGIDDVSPRKHQTYVVAVMNKIYWPRVKGLTLVPRVHDQTKSGNK